MLRVKYHMINKCNIKYQLPRVPRPVLEDILSNFSELFKSKRKVNNHAVKSRPLHETIVVNDFGVRVLDYAIMWIYVCDH